MVLITELIYHLPEAMDIINAPGEIEGLKS